MSLHVLMHTRVRTRIRTAFCRVAALARHHAVLAPHMLPLLLTMLPLLLTCCPCSSHAALAPHMLPLLRTMLPLLLTMAPFAAGACHDQLATRHASRDRARARLGTRFTHRPTLSSTHQMEIYLGHTEEGVSTGRPFEIAPDPHQTRARPAHAGALAHAVATRAGCDLQVQTRKGTGCFIDLGVYTCNRLFRVCGSAKSGGGAPPLRPETYLSGLGQTPVGLAAWLRASLVVPTAQDSHGAALLTLPAHVPHTTHCCITPETKRHRTGSALWRLLCRGSGDVPSSLAPLADWALAEMRSWPTPATHIADWRLELHGARHRFVAVAGGSRYCLAIGREHRENRVLVSVVWSQKTGVQAGVQRCFSQGCAGRSRPLLSQPHSTVIP